MRKIRLTGGEPLVRRDIMTLFGSLSRHLDSGALDELTLTTNGSQLARYAAELAAAGCGASMCRWIPSIRQVPGASPAGATSRRSWTGIDAAQAAGLKVKINTVALKGVNEDEIPTLIDWAHGRGMDLTLIEDDAARRDRGDRADQYLPLSWSARASWTATPSRISPIRTGGPARYVRVKETGGQARLHHADDP